MQIKAAVVAAKAEPFSIEMLELEDPRDDEVLVRMVGVGICHTDLVVRDQYYPTPLPAVLGHEGAGVVERVGARVAKVQAGDHVVLSYLSCATCPKLPAGTDRLLPSSVRPQLRRGAPGRLQGASPRGPRDQQPLLWPVLLRDPCARQPAQCRQGAPGRSPELLGPLGCGIQTGAGGVMNSLNPRAGSSIAVFGTGSVGLSAIMAAKVVGCTTIIAIDIKPGRLALARARRHPYGESDRGRPGRGDP